MPPRSADWGAWATSPVLGGMCAPSPERGRADGLQLNVKAMRMLTLGTW